MTNAVNNSDVAFGKESRRRESRDRILVAAEEQLREEELELFSIDRVLERADVTVGTFYRIFCGKEALLRTVQERLYSRMQPAILEALGAEEEALESLEQAVDHAFGVMIDHVLAERELCRAFMMLSSLDPRLRDDFRRTHIERRDALTAVLEKHRDEINHPDPDMAIHHAYHLYLATIHGRLAFMRPGGGQVFGISNDVFFDQLQRSIRNFLLGSDSGTPPRDTGATAKHRPRPRKGSAMEHNWHLKGKFYESCRQSGHCALWFGRDLTEGPCTSLAVFQVEKGEIDGVAMDGICIINCGDGIGPTQKDLDRSLGGGIEEGTVYISEEADEEQQKILKDFMQNHLGTELWKKVLDVKFAHIDIEYDPAEGHCHISYPYGETTMDFARGIGGKPVMLQNCDAYNQSVPINDYHVCNSWQWWYKDEAVGKDYEFKHTSGTIGDFDVSSD